MMSKFREYLRGFPVAPQRSSLPGEGDANVDVELLQIWPF